MALFRIFMINILLFYSLIQLIDCADNVKCVVNPGLPANDSSSSVNLVYIKSTHSKDLINYLWVTSVRNETPPTILIVQTPLDDVLTINWENLINSKDLKDVAGSISFHNPINSIGLEISSIYLFDDVNQTGTYNTNYTLHKIPWEGLVWDKVQCPQQKQLNSVEIKFTQNTKYLNGTIDIQMFMSHEDGRDDILPHLAYSNQSTLLEITVNKVIISEFKYPRLMTNLTIVIPDNQEELKNIQKINSIDDEYTPGVFDRILLNMSSSNNPNNPQRSFIEWKPISYNQDERIIANTLDVINGQIIHQKTFSNISIPLIAFFNKTYKIATMNLTYGAPDIKTYYNDNGNNYNSFSLVIGLGVSPEQNLSLLVQIIIIVGAGLPLIVLVISAIYLVVKKLKNRRNTTLL